MKLIFASPTYGPVDPSCAISHRVAIMHAAANGISWLGDASPDRVGWEGARNLVVESVLKSDADAVFWVDSDVRLPSHAITSLARSGHDFITGLYFARRRPHHPQIYMFDKRLAVFSPLAEWPPDVVAPVDGCGFGCVLTSIAMLRAIPVPHFEHGRYGEDLTFCLNARRAGFTLYVRTGLLCDHMKDPEPATIDDFRAERPTLREVAMAPAGGAA